MLYHPNAAPHARNTVVLTGYQALALAAARSRTAPPS